MVKFSLVSKDSCGDRMRNMDCYICNQLLSHTQQRVNISSNDNTAINNIILEYLYTTESTKPPPTLVIRLRI